MDYWRQLSRNAEISDSPFRIFIGYDPRESAAYHTLSQSIMDHASAPISITPLNLDNLPIYERGDRGSTDFAFSRFLVPYLSGFSGQALFMDCDMLLRGDICELWRELDFWSAVQVVKHDYQTKAQTKFLGQENFQYPRKNWSSVMLFNCAHYHCRKLTPSLVNDATGKFLHQFEWTDRVGNLDPKWNYLVGEDQPDIDPVNVHFTLGGPYFTDYAQCDYAEEWWHTYRRMIRVDQK